jgi:L-amino acid N-acyltransferase YncA
VFEVCGQGGEGVGVGEICCFGYMMTMVRKARLADLNQVISIYQSWCINRDKLDDYKYCAELQKRGFLLGLDDRDTYQRLIDKARLFYVFVESRKVLGYAIFNQDIESEDNRYKVWLDSEGRELYYNNSASVSIFEIAVRKDASRRGVASKLLKKAIVGLKSQGYRYLFSVVTVSPITNCSSIIFHEKHGFRRVATGVPTRLFDIDNYASILYCKVL